MHVINAMEGMTEPPMSMDNMTHGMGHEEGMDHGEMGGMHSMYFSFSLPVQVMFYEWNIVTQGQLIGSCIGVFFLALFYEGLKVWRQYLLNSAKRSKKRQSYSDKNSDQGSYKKQNSTWGKIFDGSHIVQSLLQIIQTTHGMFLMLIYMSFNVWLAVSVSLGSGIGYFMFAWILPVNPDFGDHCQ